MLRTLLSIFGVVFIGLGLFGGPLLEQLHQRVSGNPMAFAQAANGQIGNASQNAVVNNATANTVQAPTQVVAQDTQVATTQVLAQATAHTSTLASGQLQPAVQVQTSQATSNNASIEMTAATKVIPAVAMQKPTDETMSRNEQLAILDRAITSTSVESRVATQAQAQPQTQPTAQNQAASQVATQATSQATTQVAALDNSKAASPALGSDILLVMKDQVNMREGPSIDHPIVLQLQKGQELMEFKREGRWIHVGAYGTSGKIGWVHQRLIESKNQ